MTSRDSLESLYYITLGENFSLPSGAIKIDPAIPLPVQRKDKDSPGTFNMSELTEEQILAGLLTVAAYDSRNKNMEYYRSLLKKARPNLKKELSEAAILKAKNGDFALAGEIFSALRGFDPDDIPTILNSAIFFDQRADSSRKSGEIKEADSYDASALDFYKIAMSAEPVIPDAFFNAGFFYMKKRDFSEAKHCFETYVDLVEKADELIESGRSEKSSSNANSDSAKNENEQYKLNRAKQILNEIKSQNTDDSRFKKAYELISKGEEEKGLDEIRQFLQKNPDVWNAWFMLGWGLRKLKRFDDARKVFEKTLEFDGGKICDTYNELAICCMEQRDFSSARKNLEAALFLESENTKIISNLGFLALKEGNPALAASYFQTVLEFDPQDKIARAELERLNV